MSFSSPHAIVVIGFIILLIGVLALYYKAHKDEYVLQKSFWPTMTTYKGHDWLRRLKVIFLGLAFILFTIALLRPTWGEQVQTITASGSDVLFVLDVSKSMNALDMSTRRKTIDRLTAAKVLIADMVQRHPNNRYGLVLFAGDTFVSVPLTADTATFISLLNTANTNDIAVQGTDLVGALTMSLARFSDFSDEEKRAQSILLISDGGEDAPPELAAVAEEAKQRGIRIYTLGIGGNEPTRIPEGTDAFGRIQYKTHDGKLVTTQLNEEPLKKIAALTDGQYVHLESGKDFEKVAQELNTLDTSTITTGEQSKKEEQYQLFLGIGLLFFSLSVFLEKLLLLADLIKHTYKHYLKAHHDA